MIIDIITIFPEVFQNFLETSIVKRAITNDKLIVNLHQLRNYSHNKHKNIDDTPYGGGAGMLMAFPPFYDAIMALKKENTKVIYLSPQGELLTQSIAFEFKDYEHLILLCGHYEGIDARIDSLIDYEISIGDYILTGGEIPAMVLIDTITRLIPGVISDESVLEETFSYGLLKYPQYTKPEEYQGLKVPEILLSGHHKNILNWRREMSLKKTFEKRPDLLKKAKLSQSDLDLVKNIANNK